MAVLRGGSPQPGLATSVRPIAHVLAGAMSGALVVAGFQYLLVRWTEGGIHRACRTPQ